MTLQTTERMFIDFLYREYYLKSTIADPPYDEELYEYFTMKYTEDIVELFIEFRNISRHYNLSLFNSKHDAGSLQDFLFSHLLLQDPYIDSDEEAFETDNIDYSIDDSTI